MPSKRTNDSVDRILEDLNIQQAQAGLRDSVTDRQVDEILRSVGITTAPAQPAPDRSPAPGADDGLDALLQQPAAAVQPAPRPARQTQPAPYTPARQSAQPVQGTRPPQQTMPTPAAAENTTGSLGYDGDTTRTGIIKDFLLKMAPDGSAADTDALNQGKNQFQKFFKNSVAVVPDEKGRMPKPEKKKRGFLGLKHAEDTGAFVPINVSLSGKNAEYEDDPAMQQEYYPDQEPEQPPQRSAEPRRKQGFLGGFFAPEEETEELMIPEERAEEPARTAPSSQPVRSAEPETDREDPMQEVWRSKYTRPARRGAEEQGGQTMDFIRSTVDQAQKHPSDTLAGGMTGTIYRKKRNTVEFTPGKKPQTAPPQQPVPQRSGEPVGEPIEVPRSQPVPSGFTMQIGGLDTVPTDSTQEFMSAYNAVRPHTAQPQPAQPAAPQPAPQVDTVPQPDTAAPAPAVDEPTLMADSYHHTRDAVDDLVDTLTGRIRLTPVTPDAAQPAQTQPFRQAPQAQPAHTGFTQDLGSYAAPAAPAHTGFTQNLGQAPVEPATGSFVDNIANAINTGAISDETTRYDEMAARLTSNLEEEAGESTAHTGLLDKFRLGGFHLGGKADDESADSAAQPFDTAEIPVSRRRDYESAEDAPAVRKELDENLLHLTTACIVSGAAALVLLVLAFIAAALPAMPGVLAGETVYPAVALVLLAVAAGINWKTLLNGLQGLAKKPTPDSLTALAVVGALLQALIVLVTKGYTNEVTLLAGPAALVLCVNTVGKRMNAATVRDNFQLVSKNVDHAVAYRLKDAGALRAASQGLAQPHPSVLVSRPTQIFRGFLASSAAAGTSDKNQQQFAWAAGGCALLGFLITVIRTHNLTSAVTILASILCLAAPLAGTLLAALPARLMQRSAAQVGAVVPGWRDIRQLGRINVIQVTARDLFPQGCVTLAGIKPIKNAPIDLAIVYAASIMAEACPTLRDVFLNMLGDRSMIAKVDDREAVYGKGYIGWVNKRRVLVGNRSLMQDYGVKLPSLEYEQHHTVNQRRMIYLAVSGKLFAMFQVAYQRDPDTAAVLDSLRHSGLSLIVDCDDFNCDTALLEAAYSLPAGAVKVLNTAEHELMNPATAWLPESDGNMLHLGSFASFVGGLEAAAGAAEGERKSAVVVTASVLISCVLGVLLTLTGGLATLPLPALVLYQAAWCVLAMIFPLFQRY